MTTPNDSERSFSFRQATNADYDFLYQLHVSSMGEYIKLLWGWEETWQQEYFARKFDPDKRRIIQVEGEDAGVLVLEDRQSDVYIALIELLPAYQGRGVGSAIIRDLLDDAG